MPAWQEQTFISDTRQLKQQGMLVNFILVPTVIISHVLDLAVAVRTTSFLMHVYNLYANSMQAWPVLYFHNVEFCISKIK